MSEQTERALEAIEVAKNTGKLKKGTNEATKALERGTAKLVVVAKDVTPPEITMHIPILAKEKGIPCVEVPTKEELGASAGIKVGTSAVAIIAEGDAKKIIAELKPAAKKPEAQKEEKAAETKKE
ncbi:50S ribosomal protein L7ae [Candidatus Woesearchaeota archaeon]|nr:50S ribosomal protein L7ae [Candidatus Woesearchaeota archaeon]